uniref:uncharacterized protein isoform X2 n=1 Tax=Myxine glutinosa TaxID=7769 RepID=UPI00358E5CFF
MSFLSQKKPEMAGMLSTSLEVGRVADKMPVRVESAEPILLSLSKYQEEDGAQAAQAKDKGKWSGTMAGMLSTSLEVGRVADKMPVRVESAEPILLSLSKYQEEDGAQAAQAKDKGKWSGTEGDGKLMGSNAKQTSLNFPEEFLDSLLKEQQAMVENTFNEIYQQFETTKERVEMIHSKTGELLNTTVQMEHYWMEQKNELKGRLLQLSNVMDLNN